MERKVSVYPFPFGTRVFMHRNGVIREAEYRGMRIKDTGICGNNVDTEHIFWFGSKLGEEKFKVSMPIYKTAEDAAQETNPVQYEVLNIESFSLKYLPYLVWDGIQFCGWLWDGSRPVKRATREPLRVCKIYGGKVTFVDYSGNEYFRIDREIFMQPENRNKIFILGTRKTGCDLIILGGTNCDEGSMDWLFGSLGNENFYVCKPLSFYKSQQEIQKVNPLYAFKVATAYFREQGKVPVFEDSNCRLIKL